VAVEMAHQLRAQGEEVPVLALFEFYSPEAKHSRTSSQYLSKKFKYYRDQINKLPQQKKIISILNGAYNVIVRNVKKLRKGREFVYDFQPYAGNVVLFKAKIRSAIFKDDPNMGWSNYFTGKMELYEIEGDHHTMFKEPGVNQLAEKLTEILDHDS